MMRSISCGVSVYPDFENPGTMTRIHEYIRKAARLGYGEVFSSLHIPEKDISGSLEEMAALGGFVKNCGMEFTLDFSAKEMRQFLDNPQKLAQLRRIPVDWLRMDFGFDSESICDMAQRLPIRGLMCNASVLTAEEVRETVDTVRDRLGLALRAHHNFYPRPETGLSMAFFCERSRLYLPYEVPVTACVPAFREPRQPLFEGLPTVERHRTLSSGDAAAELKHTGLIDAVLIGDSFAGDDELEDVAAVCRNAPVKLRVLPEKDISVQERRILFGGVHHVRPDSPETSLRSQSSREMATPGALIAPRSARKRHRFDITVDNENYRRYSGEMQLLLCDMPEDARVNVAARVHPQDYAKVARILPGTDFILVEGEDLN